MKDVHSVLAAALARVAGHPVSSVGQDTGAACLEDDLGIDSLGLLDLVHRLERELGIVIPDEDTGRFRTVDDVRRALQQHASITNGKATR
jgi:acyl carrier protein